MQFIDCFVKVTLRGEEDFHGGAKPRNLHLAIQPALVAPNAIKYFGNIIKLSLNFIEQQLLIEIVVFVFEELRFIKTIGALSNSLRQQIRHVN